MNHSNQINFSNVLCWGYCSEHLKMMQNGSLNGRAIHTLLFILEAIPGIGQIISLIEHLVRDCFKSSSIAPTSTAAPISATANPPARKTSHLDEFIAELGEDILPFYKNHETAFDQAQIHGRMHCSRVVLFAECMARYLITTGTPINIPLLRRVSALHDAGRKGNGEDLWEHESAVIIKTHLLKYNHLPPEATEAAEIVKKGTHCTFPNISIEKILFSSADCLDIMRPCTGRRGREGFLLKFLQLPDSSFRKALIEEAWAFIQATENLKFTTFNSLPNSDYLSKLLEMIQEEPSKYPLLNRYLFI